MWRKMEQMLFFYINPAFCVNGDFLFGENTGKVTQRKSTFFRQTRTVLKAKYVERNYL